MGRYTRSASRNEARRRIVRDWTWQACQCEHFMIDHKTLGWNASNGRINIGQCLSSDCACARYLPAPEHDHA